MHLFSKARENEYDLHSQSSTLEPGTALRLKPLMPQCEGWEASCL